MGRPRAGTRRRPRRRLWHISPDGFRQLRHDCLLSRKQAAAYLGVCLRTIQHWDSGRNRVPWSVVRLLRLRRMGDLGALCDEWSGWTLNRLGLHAPTGRTYNERDMRLWWLTCEQAGLFRARFDHPEAVDTTQENRAGVKHLFGVPASPPTSPAGWGRRPERLEGASTFPREKVGQGEKRTRETERMVVRQELPPPAEPVLDREHEEPAARSTPTDAARQPPAFERLAIQSPGTANGQGACCSAPTGAGLVSSFKQVAQRDPKSSHGAVCEGASDAR